MPSATRDRLAPPERPDDQTVARTMWRHAPTAAWLAYIVLYGPLWALLQTHAGVLAFVPVVITAYSLGAWYGVAAGVASVPATLIAGRLAGTAPEPATWLETPTLAGAAAMMLVGYAVGRIEELRASAMREVSRRRRAEASLRERDRHLAIVSDLGTRLRRCKTLEDVAAASVETLHHHFPEFRVGYTVFDETGHATRVCWWKPGGPLRTEPLPSSLVLDDSQVEWLRLTELYAIDDVHEALNPRELSTHLMERDTRAFLVGVTQHPGVKLALLTLSSPKPHTWTADERQGLGEAIGFISQTLSDIDGRQRQKESEARFRVLSEQSGAGIFLIAHRQVIYVNHALQTITGYSEPELRDRQIWRLLHPSHRALAEKAYPDRLDAPVVGVPFETQFVTKPGRTRWIEARATVIELSGEPTMLGTVLDITDRKQAAERMRADEKRFRGLLEDTLDGVAVLVNGRIAYANATLARTFGVDTREIIGRDPTLFVAPDDQARARERISKIAAGELDPSPTMYDAVRPDGTTLPLEVLSRPTEFEGRPALLVTFRNMTAWQQVEEAARRSEGRLHTLLEHQAEGVAVSAEGRLLYANRTLANMFGYDIETLRHADPLKFLIAEERPRALEHLHGLTSDDGVASHAEHTGLRADGTTFPLELIVRTTEYGGQPAVLTTYRDLTETKRVESAIREAEAKYRNLVENSLAGVYVIQDERYIYVNPRLAEITGYGTAELLALPSYLSLVVEEDRSLVAERVRQRLAGETDSDQYRVRVRRKDGRLVDLEILGGITMYSGRPAVIGTVVDITARQRAANRVRESERRFRTLFEQAPIGIVTVSSDGLLQRVNRSFCDMLGYSDTELIGAPLHDIVHPDDVSRTRTIMSGGLETASRAVRVHQRFLRKSGAAVQAETTVSVVRDDAGQPHYTVAMIEDVTEKQRLEEQLNEMMRLESVGRLAGGIAHSFNNALAAISGYSELVARRFERTDPALRDLEQIQRVTEQSAQVTRQLLAFSRGDDVRPTVFNLNDVVEATHDLLSAVLGRHIRVRRRLDRELPDISCDRSQIEQVITNLVLNARDAMPSGGTLHIETAQVEIDAETARAHPEASPGRYVRLIVRDTGNGMSDDTVERIFEPFFTTKDPGKGVGLGLAMVHGAVRQNGGFVEVETGLDEGSTFTVCLPEHPAQDVEADSSGPEARLIH